MKKSKEPPRGESAWLAAQAAMNKRNSEARDRAQEQGEAQAARAAAQRRHSYAARLFGAAEALRQSLATPLPPVAGTDYDRAVGAVRAQLDQVSFTGAWIAGREMSLEQAIAYALDQAA